MVRVLCRGVLSLALLFAASVAWAEGRIPVFDVHMHYSQSAWNQYGPQAVIDIWDKYSIERSIVSSTPDDGTVQLYKAAPGRVVPFLRPYRGQWGTGNWYEDPQVLDYLRERLKLNIHKGIGEFHLFDAAAADTANVKGVVKLAVERDLYLMVHSGAEPARRMANIDPRAKILWAHAGMSESAQTVDAMLAKYPNMITETSFRASDITAFTGGIDSGWKALMLKYPDRIMVGSDTYIVSRVGDCGELIDEHRRWLAHLPKDVAEKIAWRNAARLFGTGSRPALEAK
ncbi:MAG TPA: amidohydrolase family protein [bacterium]